MSDYKIDVIVRESKSRESVDKLFGLKPEVALFIIYSKYSGKLDKRKAFSKILSSNVDVNVDEFMRILGVKKK